MCLEAMNSGWTLWRSLFRDRPGECGEYHAGGWQRPPWREPRRGPSVARDVGHVHCSARVWLGARDWPRDPLVAWPLAPPCARGVKKNWGALQFLWHASHYVVVYGREVFNGPVYVAGAEDLTQCVRDAGSFKEEGRAFVFESCALGVEPGEALAGGGVLKCSTRELIFMCLK